MLTEQVSLISFSNREQIHRSVKSAAVLIDCDLNLRIRLSITSGITTQYLNAMVLYIYTGNNYVISTELVTGNTLFSKS